MANIRVKDLPNTNSAADTDEFIIDSSTAGTRRLSYSELKSEISTDFQGDVNTYKIATLASDNKLDPSQIPDTLSQGLNFVGVANSAGDLTSTTQGDFYVIQTAFDSYQVGDQAVYNGSSYTRVTDGTKQIAEGGTGATTLDAAKVNLEIANVGTDPSEVPLNQHLGSLAYQSAEAVSAGTVSADEVGVGVADPNAKLHVSDDTAPTLRLSRTGTGQIWQQSIDSSGRLIWQEAASEGGTKYTRAVLDDDGNFGIGTDSPDRALHCYSDSVATVLKLDSAGADTGLEFAHSDTVAAGINCSTGGDLEFRTGANSGAAERWRIDGSNGNLIASSGVGIDFGATNSTSGVTVTGSTLDHYEEGTATITDESGAGLTLTSPVCNYTRIGNKVTCWITVTYPATSDTSTAKIGGLPYAFQSVNNVKRIGGFVSYTDYGTALTILGDGGQSRVSIRSHATGAQRTNADLSGKSIWFCLIYEVA